MGGVASKYKKLYNNNDTKKNQKKSVNNRRYTNKHKSGFQMEQDIEDLKERFERIKKLITTVLKKKGVNSYNANSYKDSDDETKKQILIYIMLDAKLPNTVRTLKDKHYYYRSIMNLISIIKKDSIDDIEDHIDYIDNKIQNVKYKRIINDLINSLQNVIDKKRIKEKREKEKKEEEEEEEEENEDEENEDEENEDEENEDEENEDEEEEENKNKKKARKALARTKTKKNVNGKTNSKYDLDADEIKWLADFIDKNQDMKVNRSK